MANGRVHSQLPVRWQPAELEAGVAQLLALLLAKIGQEGHALQRLVLLFRRQAVEFPQALPQRILAIWRQLVKAGLFFQKLKLLINGQVLVGLEPVTHLS